MGYPSAAGRSIGTNNRMARVHIFTSSIPIQGLFLLEIKDSSYSVQEVIHSSVIPPPLPQMKAPAHMSPSLILWPMSPGLEAASLRRLRFPDLRLRDKPLSHTLLLES